MGLELKGAVMCRASGAVKLSEEVAIGFRPTALLPTLA